MAVLEEEVEVAAMLGEVPEVEVAVVEVGVPEEMTVKMAVSAVVKALVTIHPSGWRMYRHL